MTTDERIKLFRQKMPFVQEGIIERLNNAGFFTAPASAKHHGNYEGGLFDHSLAVATTLLELSARNGLVWQKPRSALLIGMFHDLCKIDSYTRPIVAYTNFGTPIYEQTSYEYTEDTLYKGHGEKSVFLLSTYFELTPEEVACIRYHMGAFTDRDEWKYYTRAIKEFPNVLWTHQADMIASQIKGV